MMRYSDFTGDENSLDETYRRMVRLLKMVGPCDYC